MPSRTLPDVPPRVVQQVKAALALREVAKRVKAEDGPTPLALAADRASKRICSEALTLIAEWRA